MFTRLGETVRAHRRKALLALELAMLLLVATQAARLIWIFAAPPEPTPPKAAASVFRVVDHKIFAAFDAFGSSGVALQPGAQATVEGFRLYGVRQDGSSGSAIIAGPDGVQKSFAVGEAVAQGVTLAAVGADHVELSRGGARMTLSFPERP
jgi:general secretion pathway protein C